MGIFIFVSKRKLVMISIHFLIATLVILALLENVHASSNGVAQSAYEKVAKLSQYEAESEARIKLARQKKFGDPVRLDELDSQGNRKDISMNNPSMKYLSEQMGPSLADTVKNSVKSSTQNSRKRAANYAASLTDTMHKASQFNTAQASNVETILRKHDVSDALQKEIVQMSASKIRREAIIEHIMTHYPDISRPAATDILVASHMKLDRNQPIKLEGQKYMTPEKLASYYKDHN